MMKDLPRGCREIQDDLVAAAVMEAAPLTLRRVEAHVGRCAPCRGEFERYRALEAAVGDLGRAAPGGADLARARTALEVRLADLRRRLLTYGVFASPLGRILIGRTAEGVSLVRYLPAGAAPLGGLGGLEAVEDGEEVERLYGELLEYLRGRRAGLEWPIDLSLARSDFHRAVLRATARIPYGAVTSYANLAQEVGRPAAVRAVAQALRWNPVPIAVPCHRVVGTSGSLTGYVGHRLALKQRLLGVEGIPAVRKARDLRVERAALYATQPGEDAYCLPTCGSLPSMTLRRLVLFASRERAEAAGLRPCRDCRPDLHPISR